MSSSPLHLMFTDYLCPVCSVKAAAILTWLPFLVLK